jgi:TldD protein
VGHGLEADFNRKRDLELLGPRRRSGGLARWCTVVDDPTSRNARGSINVDDEGNPRARNVLIEQRSSCAATCRIG